MKNQKKHNWNFTKEQQSFVNIQMVEYNKVNVKLSDSQLNKLQSAVKNKTGVTLRMSTKIFDGNKLPHELLLTTRQKTKLKMLLKIIH